MKQLVSTLILLILVGACGSTPISQMDRSRLNSNIMNAETYSTFNALSPHTSLRNLDAGGTNGCSVCAH